MESDFEPRYDLRKMPKISGDLSSRVRFPSSDSQENTSRKGKHSPRKEKHKSEVSICQMYSLEFHPLSQERLREIFGERPNRSITGIELKESDESEEEEEGLTYEELMETPGCKAIMEDLNAIFQKPH